MQLWDSFWVALRMQPKRRHRIVTLGLAFLCSACGGVLHALQLELYLTFTQQEIILLHAKRTGPLLRDLSSAEVVDLKAITQVLASNFNFNLA